MTDSNKTDTAPQTAPCWWLYLLDCDGRLYTGISTDPIRRLREHQSGGARAAKFSRSSRHIDLKYSVPVGERGLALSIEYHIKQQSRQCKLAIVQQQPDLSALINLLGLSW